MSAKWYKLHSHELFPNEPSLWIDAHYALKVRPVREFASLTEETPIALFKHPFKTLGLEYLVVAERQKEQRYIDLIFEQSARYLQEGFRVGHAPAYKGAVLFRHQNIAEFNEAWWEEILRYEHRRDQLSLSYVLWKTGTICTEYDNPNKRVCKATHHAYTWSRETKP